MKKILSISMFFICITMLFVQCTHPTQVDPGTCFGVICTAEFRMKTANIQDAQGNPFVLDKVETVFNNAVIHTSTEPLLPMSSRYTIVDDSHIGVLGFNSQNTVTFNIYKNNVIVKSINYVIQIDCCHIGMQIDDELIIIQ